MINKQSLYLAVKKPEDKDYCIVAKRKLNFLTTIKCIDDLPAFYNEVINFNNFIVAETDLSKFGLEGVSEDMKLEALVIFDLNLDQNSEQKLEAFFFDSVYIEKEEDIVKFSGGGSDLRVDVEVNGECASLIGEVEKSKKTYLL